MAADIDHNPLSQNERCFRQWCIVELFGHSIIAGLVSEQSIGGSSFVRIDVPKTATRDAYTKLYGTGAIYAITPTDEETAHRLAASMDTPPVQEWRFKQTVSQLPSPEESPDADEDIPW